MGHGSQGSGGGGGRAASGGGMEGEIETQTHKTHTQTNTHTHKSLASLSLFALVFFRSEREPAASPRHQQQEDGLLTRSQQARVFRGCTPTGLLYAVTSRGEGRGGRDSSVLMGCVGGLYLLGVGTLLCFVLLLDYASRAA